MRKVFINKLRDRYDCIITENGKETGGVHTFYSLEAANEFVNKETAKDKETEEENIPEK